MAMKTLALAVALSLVPAAGLAQTPPAPAPAPPPQARYRTPVFEIEGRVAHPFFWVHTRSAPRYVPAEPRRSFTPTVVEAVRRNPF